MKTVSLVRIIGFAALLVALVGGGAQAAEKGKKGELSVRSVKLITGFALTTIPSEIKEPNGNVLKIDKSDLSKVLIPLGDARRVIKIAYLSAQAYLCDMPGLQAQNYLAMMRQEQATKKWNKQQLLFINRLHLFTVMWLTGNVKFVEKNGKKEAKVIAEQDESGRPKCTDAKRKSVRQEIESYLKTVKKS